MQSPDVFVRLPLLSRHLESTCTCTKDCEPHGLKTRKEDGGPTCDNVDQLVCDSGLATTIVLHLQSGDHVRSIL